MFIFLCSRINNEEKKKKSKGYWLSGLRFFFFFMLFLFFIIFYFLCFFFFCFFFFFFFFFYIPFFSFGVRLARVARNSSVLMQLIARCLLYLIEDREGRDRETKRRTKEAHR